MSAPDRTLLGGLAVSRFLRRHWQKRAHLVRQAIPGFEGPLDRAALLALAARDDVESRLVLKERDRYTLAHGPFRRGDFRALPARGWTLLVQGVNLHDDAADALLRRFAFLPYARLDDVMVSYAVPGGGVGPHVDSYDVFLLQGFGRRRWRYGRQRDLSLLPGRPLKILRTFTPSVSQLLHPGDMLYLPPDHAHEGVALDACTTWSIGFRAPTAHELGQRLLEFLADALDADGRYADPDLRPTVAPARIDAAMSRRMAQLLARVRWDARPLAQFLGSFLTEPKASVVFEAPSPESPRAAFAKRVRTKGIVLDRRTQMLYDDTCVYVNGDASPWPAGARSLRALADARRLSARDCAVLPDATLSILHDWYRHGFLTPGE